jgi:hypothetical protein
MDDFEYKLPKVARLAKGTRLLNPFTGTYYKYGGRWVSVRRWAENGKLVVCMTTGAIINSEKATCTLCERLNDNDYWAVTKVYYLVDPEQIGLPKYVAPVQQKLPFEEIMEIK